MATLSQKIQCERRAREMLKDGGLPEPDRIEYGHTCIRLFWEDTKVVLVVDIDEPPEGLEVVGEHLGKDNPLEPGNGRNDADDFEEIDDPEYEEDPVDDEEVAEILRRLGLDDEEEAA